ncbi:MAG: Yip1 family protein [Pseudomonadota bacterium]
MTDMLRALLQLTFRDSATAARRVIELDLPLAFLIQLGVAIALIDVVLGSIALAVTGVPEGGPLPLTLIAPFALAVQQVLFFFIGAGLIWWVGQSLGGTGHLEGAVAITVWVMAIGMLVQGVATLMTLTAALGGLVIFAGFIWQIWLLAQGIRALHGFPSTGLVILGICLVGFGMAILLTLVFAMFGLLPMPPEAAQ